MKQSVWRKCFWVWEIERLHWEMLARTGPALFSCGWLMWPASWGRLKNGGALGWGWGVCDRGESLSCTMAVAMNRQRRRPSLHDEHTIVTFGTPAYGWGGVGFAPSPRPALLCTDYPRSFIRKLEAPASGTSQHITSFDSTTAMVIVKWETQVPPRMTSSTSFIWPSWALSTSSPPCCNLSRYKHKHKHKDLWWAQQH